MLPFPPARRAPRAPALAALALAALLLAPPSAPAAPLPPPLDELEGVFVTVDPDGGRTLRLLLEDGADGTYAYTRADASNTHETLGGLLARVDPATGRLVAGQQEPIREAGVYTHAWLRGASPMLTLGLYVIRDPEGMLRAPLVLFENVTDADALVDAAQALALDDGTDMATHAVPFLTEWALPEYAAGFQSWPAASGVNSFRDYPRVYAWTVHKATPAGEVWEGAYLERLGAHTGGGSPAEAFDGTKSIEVGAALRLDDATTRVAGAYAETHLQKAPGQPQAAQQRITLGAVSEATGRVPLAGLDLQDQRAGTQQFTFPAEQRTGIVLGAYVAGAWTPLLGTWTEARHAPGANGDVEQTRLTSVGPYVGGAYAPVAGVRYHGDRSTLEGWALDFAGDGGPGASTMGDWELDAGAFAGPDFVPLVGATYADDFPEARFRYQMQVTAGVHTPLGYQPLIGATYDGQRPFVTWAQAWAAGQRSNTLDWMVSVGGFAGAQYVPVLGARYENSAPLGSRAYQEHYTLGTYAADYRMFIPLLGATFDGDQQHVAWATAFATRGTLGAPTGDWDVDAGTYAMGAWQPALGVRYRDDYNAAYGSQTFVTVGAWVGPDFVPLVGASYSGARPFVDSLGRPQDLGDDTRAFVTAGVFVQGAYQPLVMVENNGQTVSMGLLPPTY